MAAVRSGKVTDAEAETLGFVPPDMRHSEAVMTVTAEDALHKTEAFHWRPTTKGRLRTCPACGLVPQISRQALYARAFDAVGREERTIYL